MKCAKQIAGVPHISQFISFFLPKRFKTLRL